MPTSEDCPLGESCSAQDASSEGAPEEKEWDVDIEVELEGLSLNEEVLDMPEEATRRRAAAAKRRGDNSSTQAGAFVREEMHHKASRKHGALSRKQAIAIGLSKAREAGIRVPPKGRSTRS
jgi:Family of unknown function (DUF6496)